MTDIAIRVANLSKLYHIGRARQRHDTLRDALVEFLPRTLRLRSGQASRINTKRDREIRENSSNSWQKESDDDAFWALRDVSFEACPEVRRRICPEVRRRIKRGEVVGTIGRNGAGKSTLLKVLSRITEPTSGRAEIHGRACPEPVEGVGTGFHPELTGWENTCLNGAILGMKRTEMGIRVR